MTKNEAVDLVRQYCDYLQQQTVRPGENVLEDAQGMAKRWPENGSVAKAMRWLGYIQGVCVAHGLFYLDQVKQHSQRKWVTYDPKHKWPPSVFLGDD